MATKQSKDLVRVALEMRRDRHTLFDEFREQLKNAASAPPETLQEIADILVKGVYPGPEGDRDATVSALFEFFLSEE